MLSWNDPSLLVASDGRRRARYRLLQSWYRETVLRVGPGGPGKKKRGDGELVASMLPTVEGGLNFLDPVVSQYVDERIPQVRREGGTLNEDRLRRNMLSSMPLCFNLFGYLREHRAAAATILSDLLDLDVATLDDIVVEWAPPSKDHLRDRTAFDAFVAYRDRSDRHCFLAVETKYTEPLSEKAYDTEIYRARTTSDWGFIDGAADSLRQRATNQLWRNVMLAMSLRRAGQYHAGHVVVLACEGDDGADKAVAGLREKLRRPEDELKATTLEKLIGALDQGETAPFAQAFRKRYLDLSVLSGSD